MPALNKRSSAKGKSVPKNIREHAVYESVEQVRKDLHDALRMMTPREQKQVLALLRDQSWILDCDPQPSEYVDGLCDSLAMPFAKYAR